MKLQVCPRWIVCLTDTGADCGCRLRLQTAWSHVDAAAPTETRQLRNTDRTGQSLGLGLGLGSWSSTLVHQQQVMSTLAAIVLLHTTAGSLRVILVCVSEHHHRRHHHHHHSGPRDLDSPNVACSVSDNIETRRPRSSVPIGAAPSHQGGTHAQLAFNSSACVAEHLRPVL